MGIQIQVNYIADSYNAEVYPPAPGTLLQALIAGSFPSSREASRPAILMMESWGAPTIVCPPVTEGTRVSTHPRDNVENFDSCVLYGGRAGRSANCTIPRRQRHFKDKPEITYFWNVNPGEEEFQQLEAVVDQLHTLGRGDDDAYATISRTHSVIAPGGWSKYVVTDEQTDLVLTVPERGSLEAIEHDYEHKYLSGLFQRPGSICPSYNFKRVGEVATRYAAFSLLNESLKPLNYRWSNMGDVAAWFRHAIHDLMADEVPQDIFSGFLMGHHEDRSEENQRLAILPLPSVGEHADGGIRRVLIAEPRLIHPKYKGILSILTTKLAGFVKRLDAQGGHIEAVPVTRWEDQMIGKYVRSGNMWTTTTPVILHGHNTRQGMFDGGKTHKMLAQAFHQAGVSYELLESVDFHRAPRLPGLGAATTIQTPENLRRYPKYHVTVKFRDKFQGPLFAGIGRHRGLGTFVCID